MIFKIIIVCLLIWIACELNEINEYLFKIKKEMTDDIKNSIGTNTASINMRLDRIAQRRR